MKKFAMLVLGLSLLLTFSCQKNTTQPGDDLSATEKQNIEAIKSVLQDSADISYDALDDASEDNIDTDDPNWLGGQPLSKTSWVRTHFGRIGKRPVERSIQVVLDTDSTATAYVYTKLKGIFVVRKAEMDSNHFSLDRFEKPMTHEVERIVHLKKINVSDTLRRNWKIVDISMKEGASPENTVEIVQLDVVPTGMDSVVITDALSYFQDRRTLFTYKRGTEIKLRVTVRNSSASPMIYPQGTLATENVRLHYGRNMAGNFARKNFTWVGQDAEGNNVYEGVWIIKQFPGVHHAVIDVIDNGTILSKDKDAYPYNSNTWSTPYRVTHL